MTLSRIFRFFIEELSSLPCVVMSLPPAGHSGCETLALSLLARYRIVISAFRGRNGCIGKSLDSVNGILTVKPPLEQNADAPTEHSTQMLSDTEKKLCKRIGMKTSSYMTLKTCILKVGKLIGTVP